MTDYQTWKNDHIHTVAARRVCDLVHDMWFAVTNRYQCEKEILDPNCPGWVEYMIGLYTYDIAAVCDDLAELGYNPIDYLDYFLAGVEG